MRYVISRLQNESEEMAYRIYISESLRLQGENKYLTARYIDIIRPKKDEVINEQEADDIAEEVIKKMGLKVGE